MPYTLYAGGYEKKVLKLSFTPKTRTLAVDAAIEVGLAPTWLEFSSERDTLYAIDEWGEPLGELFSVALPSMKVSSSTSSLGEWPCHGVLTHTTPPKLVVTNYKGATLVSVTVLPDSTFDTSSPPSSVSFKGPSVIPGPHPTRQNQSHPHEAHLDPSGKVLVVPDLGSDDLHLFSVSASGDLSPHPSIKVRPGSGPRHVKFSPIIDGKSTLYVLNELSNSISSFGLNYTASSPIPTFSPEADSVSVLPSKPFGHQADFSEWHAAELAISPSGDKLYVSNRHGAHAPLEGTAEGDEDLMAIVMLPLSGTSEIKLVGSGGRAPRHFSISPDGAFVAVALHDSDEVVIFEEKGWQEVARLRGAGRPGIVLWA